MRAEISYDLVMEEDMSFVEGTFRLPGGEWQVVIVSRASIPSPEAKSTTWESSVTGLFVTFPKELKLNKAAVETILGQAFGGQRMGRSAWSWLNSVAVNTGVACQGLRHHRQADE